MGPLDGPIRSFALGYNTAGLYTTVQSVEGFRTMPRFPSRAVTVDLTSIVVVDTRVIVDVATASSCVTVVTPLVITTVPATTEICVVPTVVYIFKGGAVLVSVMETVGAAAAEREGRT